MTSEYFNRNCNGWMTGSARVDQDLVKGPNQIPILEPPEFGSIDFSRERLLVTVGI